jgi:hypothetical protein
MHEPASLRLTLAAMLALASVTPAGAQTAPSATPPPAIDPAASDDVDWFGLGAIAECRDGAFVHGKPGARACADHGGIRRWLAGYDQDLIR